MFVSVAKSWLTSLNFYLLSHDNKLDKLVKFSSVRSHFCIFLTLSYFFKQPVGGAVNNLENAQNAVFVLLGVNSFILKYFYKFYNLDYFYKPINSLSANRRLSCSSAVLVQLLMKWKSEIPKQEAATNRKSCVDCALTPSVPHVDRDTDTLQTDYMTVLQIVPLFLNVEHSVIMMWETTGVQCCWEMSIDQKPEEK